MITEEQRRLNKLLKERYAYVHANKIEYFGIKDEEEAEIHKDCCKLFRGPNPKQKLIIDNWYDLEKRIFCLTGSDKFGKTTMGAILAISLCKGYWPWDKEKKPISNPPVIVRWIGQDWEVHIKTVIEMMLDDWWPKNFGVTTSKNNQGVKATWNCVNKSILYLLSNKQDERVHAGKDPHYVLYDEPPVRGIYIENARGLSATTADPPSFEGRTFLSASLIREPWVYREIIRRRNKDGTPDMSVYNVHGEIYDNLGYGLTQAGIDIFASNLTSEEKLIRLYGKPAFLSGLIYPQYDRDKHVEKPFKVPLEDIVDIAIDCHPSKENAVLFMSTDKRNYKHLVDEIFMHGDGTEIGDEIIRKVTQNAYRVGSVLIDSSAKGDTNNTFSTFEKVDAVLNKYGFYLQTYKKDEDGGIKNARKLLLSPNREVVLKIFSDLPRTIFEIEGYMIDIKTQKPQTIDNDMMDNLYALANLDTQWYSPIMSRMSSKPANWRVA